MQAITILGQKTCKEWKPQEYQQIKNKNYNLNSKKDIGRHKRCTFICNASKKEEGLAVLLSVSLSNYFYAGDSRRRHVMLDNL